MTATAEDGETTTFTEINRCDTEIEVRYYRHGGILHYVLRNTPQDAPVTAEPPTSLFDESASGIPSPAPADHSSS